MTELFRFQPEGGTPIICDFTEASDTPEERLAEYGRLFEAALVSRERTVDGVKLTFSAGDAVAEWVADLAAREAACCPFMSYDVTADDDAVTWVTSGTPEMQPILDHYYDLYQVAIEGFEPLSRRLADSGFEIRVTR